MNDTYFLKIEVDLPVQMKLIDSKLDVVHDGEEKGAWILSMDYDEVFGDLPITSKHSDFDAIRVGDILRINNNTHSVVVLEKRADSVIVTEGNYNSSIHWGREISRSTLENGNFYAQSRYPA